MGSNVMKIVPGTRLLPQLIAELDEWKSNQFFGGDIASVVLTLVTDLLETIETNDKPRADALTYQLLDALDKLQNFFQAVHDEEVTPESLQGLFQSIALSQKAQSDAESRIQALLLEIQKLEADKASIVQVLKEKSREAEEFKEKFETVSAARTSEFNRLLKRLETEIESLRQADLARQEGIKTATELIGKLNSSLLESSSRAGEIGSLLPLLEQVSLKTRSEVLGISEKHTAAVVSSEETEKISELFIKIPMEILRREDWLRQMAEVSNSVTSQIEVLEEQIASDPTNLKLQRSKKYLIEYAETVLQPAEQKVQTELSELRRLETYLDKISRAATLDSFASELPAISPLEDKPEPENVTSTTQIVNAVERSEKVIALCAAHGLSVVEVLLLSLYQALHVAHSAGRPVVNAKKTKGLFVMVKASKNAGVWQTFGLNDQSVFANGFSGHRVDKYLQFAGNAGKQSMYWSKDNLPWQVEEVLTESEQELFITAIIEALPR